MLVGCKTTVQVDEESNRTLRAFDFACRSVVPLPEDTPYDTNKVARTAYLSAYQDGYRSGLTSCNICFGHPTNGFDSFSYSTARAQGYEDGTKAGFHFHTQDVPKTAAP